MSIFTNPATGAPSRAAVYIASVLELLGDRDPYEVLEATPDALARARAGLSAEQVVRPEAPGKWSVRHVLQHLVDSELVWGYRVRMVLAHERPSLTGYDQDLWAERLRYVESDADRALADFGALRRANLRLLRGASPSDLARVGEHAERGEESLEHMVRLYAGHDLVHQRQLARIREAVTSD